MSLTRTAEERFLRYVAIETTSCPDCEQVPSTACQFELANLLAAELRELGLHDAAVDEHCYVTASLPANVAGREVPVIGWIAHLDTSPDVSGKNVRPQVRDYQGGEIALPNGKIITEDEALKSCRGHKIVTSDGSTLLGADDKAGIAAVMTAVERLLTENQPHGVIKICFTPDEEVGNGTQFFDLQRFGAECAYTVDGELPGELNRETFTAKAAVIRVTGREIHPGTAKGIMVNASRIAAEIIALMPKNQAPETTEGDEPYLHPYHVEGNVAAAAVRVLLRSFDDTQMNQLENRLQEILTQVRSDFPGALVELTVKEQYRNMREGVDQHPEILQKLEEAARRSGVTPCWQPIRGGTDGSRLTEMGLPTPNIYTGGHNFHSATEWLSVNHLETTVETLVQLAYVWAE
ncbi:MAG: peptidase T [Planctomycetaceae bacterium]|nr:peptidase T [Planctomycetaceae bacterium]